MLTLTTTTAATLHEAVRHFDIPAGPAARALELFSRQAGRPAVFLTDMVEGVQTARVAGEYTDLAALQQMFAGTALAPAFDEEAGVLVLHAVTDARTSASPAAAAPRPAVRKPIPLPPFLVEENLAKHPWRYARLPGLEVLSYCPDDITAHVVAQYYRLHALLQLLLPDSLQGRMDAPVYCILYDAGVQTALSRQLVERLTAKAERRAEGDFLVMPNFRLWDQDSLAIFFSLDTAPFNRYNLRTAELMLTSDYVHYLAALRTPTLPAWFVAGVTELYRGLELTAPPEPTRADVGFGMRDVAADGARIQFRPFVWISADATRELAREPAQAPFLPLARLFAEPAPDEAPELAAVRTTEAALFLRWVLDPEKPEAERTEAGNDLPAPPPPAALWEFVAALATGAPPAETSRRCFGTDLAQLDRQLRAYQLSVLRYPAGFRLRLAQAVPAPAMDIRDAAPAETGRIKGRLERLNVNYVRAVYPELASSYLNQARGTLQRALADAPDDAQLLAEAGLCEAEAGETGLARHYLAAAAQDNVVHPRVYGELARIELGAAASTGDAKLPPESVARLLGLLDRADRQAPALRENYLLRARIVMQSPSLISAAQLQALARGLDEFPRDGELYYATALATAMAGRGAVALAQCERGVAVAHDPAVQQRLRRLQEALSADAKPMTNAAP